MIDWTAFIDSLDEPNFEDIFEAVKARKVDEAETVAQAIVLSFSEVQMARENSMGAILMVRNRLGCNFLIAKTAVALVLEADEEDSANREDGGDWPPQDESPDDLQETVIGMDQPLAD